MLEFNIKGEFMRYLLILFFIFFSGFAVAKEPINTQNSNPSLSGYIKGVIKTLYLKDDGVSWYYEIVGKDKKNGKLSKANFTHNKKEFEEDSFVYAQIKNGKLVEIYKIDGGKFLKPKKEIYKQTSKDKNSPLGRRTKNRQKIMLPKSESIALE